MSSEEKYLSTDGFRERMLIHHAMLGGIVGTQGYQNAFWCLASGPDVLYLSSRVANVEVNESSTHRNIDWIVIKGSWNILSRKIIGCVTNH